MTQVRKRPIYDSCPIYAPDGELLCLVGEKKARWYVDRGLALPVAEGERSALSIRLLFEPKGNGHAGDPFYTRPRPNVCAACGIREHLTLHHIVPYCYRRYFPETIKSHSCHDLVPLCLSCHHQYETEAMKLKKELAEEFNAPLDGIGRQWDENAAKMRSAASALLRSIRGEAAIPPARVEELRRIVAERSGVEEIDLAFLESACDRECYTVDANFKPHGLLVTAALDDVQAFVERWRGHFMTCVQPGHMPLYWRVDRAVHEPSRSPRNAKAE